VARPGCGLGCYRTGPLPHPASRLIIAPLRPATLGEQITVKFGLLRAELLPFYARFAAMVGAALLIDLVLHLSDLVWIGRYLGIPGIILILGSFGHSLRKRGIIESANPQRLLRWHERLGWIGSTLVLVHAGIHFNAVLAWLAVAAMLVNVASGLTGKYLVKRSQAWLRETRSSLRERGSDETEIERQLFWSSLTADLVRKWRVVHLPIALAFAVLATAHLVAIFLFWGWR
jgi:hypothetical protein